MRQVLFYVVGTLLLVVLVLLALSYVRRTLVSYQAGPGPATANSLTATAIALGPTAITGTVMLDYTSATNPVPYIKYENEKGGTVTKQLIFVGPRGCNPVAGDYPCVLRNTDAAYPQLREGEAITVQGAIVDDRFIVNHLQPVEA